MLIFTSRTYSQNSISIRDTVIERGIVCKIPIYLQTDVTDIKSIELKLKFDAYALDISNASGGTDFIIQDDKINPDYNLSNLSESIVTIKSINLKNINKALCLIYLEGLAGKDTVTNITPFELIINDNIISNTQFKSGKIKINSVPILPDLKEYISNNYPNPFNTSTTFDFFLDKESKVSFSIYSLNGRLVYRFPAMNSVEFIVLDNANSNVELTENTVLKQGKYKLNITPNYYDFSSGPYYLVFRTNTQTHKVNFMYLK